MNTFKTAVVVVVMLAMAYGGWKLFNGHWKLVSASDGSNVLPDGISGTIPWSPDVDFPAPNEPEAPPFDPTGGADGGGLAIAGPPNHLGSPEGHGHGGAPIGKSGPPSDPFPVEPFGPPGKLPQVMPVNLGDESRAAEEAGAAHQGASPAAQVDWQEPAGGLQNATHASPHARGGPAATSDAFAKAWRTGLRQIEDDQLTDALYTLSAWLGSPDLTRGQTDDLQNLLDQLAGTVVYSDEHLMEPAKVVRRGERLEDIAAEFHVPWQLLAKINGIAEPYLVMPAQRLKVVKGPFAARVDLQQQQIYLYLRGYYAGRFVFTAGRDQPPRPGTYQVVSKTENRTWYDQDGYEVPPEHPDNPYGPFWIDLGSNQCLHGAAVSGPDRGCISVAPRDADDLYGILAVGSQVIIR